MALMVSATAFPASTTGSPTASAKQLAYHQWGALIKRRDGNYPTEDTYDLESSRLPLASPGIGEYRRTPCLNLINNSGEGSGINFPDALDLPPVPDHLA